LLFRLDVSEPPAASSGTVYATVDQRCEACVIYGGHEEPCVPPVWFTQFRERLGRPCPRVEIDPSLYLDVELLNFARHPDLRGLVSEKFRALSESLGLDADARDLMLSRLHAVLSDPLILARFHPGPELPEE
jgi:hypothetical protein